MNKKNEEMDVVFLLDRSGSMGGIESDTIGGYNSYIESQKNKNVRVTTVLFDDEYELLHNRVKISEVKKLTNEQYFVRGSTALLDAVGKTINMLEAANSNKVIFIITTDGLENSSIEFSKKQITKMIKKHNEWEFIYIGANIDSYAEASSLGIRSQNVANYKKSGKGVKNLFHAIGKLSCMMYDEDCIDESWKEDLKK